MQGRAGQVKAGTLVEGSEDSTGGAATCRSTVGFCCFCWGPRVVLRFVLGFVLTPAQPGSDKSAQACESYRRYIQ